MITNFKYYILESNVFINNDTFVDYIDNILTKINNEFEFKLSLEINDYLNVSIYSDNPYICDFILDIKKVYDGDIFLYGMSPNKCRLSIITDNLKDKIKNKIIMSVLSYITNNDDFNGFNYLSCDSIDELLKKILNNDIECFIQILQINILPEKYIVKYKHYLNADNFDLL